MKIRSAAIGLRWVAYFDVACGLAVGLGAVVPAQAAAGDGTISGTFFADSNQTGGLHGYPGEAQTSLPMPAGQGLCEQAVAKAGQGQQLPAGLLGAVAVVESGRLDPRTGSMKPWPWTVDANGTGYFYNSAQAAIAAAAAFQAAGISSLDVGCLQVNLAQHPDAFATLQQAFDPAANAGYAAGFLASLEQKFGNWPQAVAAYHSQTAGLGGPYAAKVYAAWQGAAPTALPAVAGAAVMPVQMASAMPPAFDLTTMAPPMATLPGAGLRAGKAMSDRGLASYRAAPVAIARLVPPG